MVLIEFSCFYRIVTRSSENPETYIFIMDSGFYPFYPHIASRNVTIQYYNVTRTFHRNLCTVKHVITLGDVITTVAYPNTWFDEIRYIDGPMCSKGKLKNNDSKSTLCS
jgi:hypothetical protein